mgnify:CR=1 FL=1
MKKTAVTLVLILCISAISFAQNVGTQVPNLIVKDYDGNSQSFTKYRGKVVLLKFWASWCGPCRASLPKTARLNRLYADKGLVIFAVGLGTTSRDKAILKRYGCNLPVTIPGRKYISQIKSKFSIRGIPHEILISKTGKILWKGHPYRFNENLLKKALGSSAASTSSSNTTSSGNANEILFNNAGGPIVGSNFKYKARGVIYPKLRSNFWGKWKRVNIGMIKYYRGYMEFTFTGPFAFNMLAAGGAIRGRSRCIVNIYLNGRLVRKNFFLNQWWNYYHIFGNTGTNKVRIVNFGRAVPWVFKTWLSKMPHEKSKPLVNEGK